MTIFLIIILALIAAFLLIAKFHLAGPNMSEYDVADTPFFYDTGEVSSGHGKIVQFLKEYMVPPKGMSMKQGLTYTHNGYEHEGLNRTFKSEFRAATAIMNGIEVAGEWTLPKNYDPAKRILFLHGGAFMIGSPISHRPMTDNLAQRTGCAIFAPDYRLCPKHSRKDGNADCKAAYDWILEHGPDGPAPCDKFGVSGDSAGGGLTLMLSIWARDNNRRAPDAAVAYAPTTDMTGASPSMESNLATDPVLSRSLGPLVKMPDFLSLWVMRMGWKINPSSPEASVVYADLHDLPPTLIQVSNTEVLYDDARRFAEKAKRADSPVELQVWAHQVHIFQHYDKIIPEAHLALDEAAKFFKANGVSAKGWKAKVNAA